MSSGLITVPGDREEEVLMNGGTATFPPGIGTIQALAEVTVSSQ